MKLNKRFLSGVIASLMGVGIQSVAANDRVGSTHGPQARVLEEVVVTARRRSENLQDVPIAITALSNEYPEQNSINNFSDIQYHAPSLTVSSVGLLRITQ